MYWTLRSTSDPLGLLVPEELLTRLQQEGRVPACFALDPYADAALGPEAQHAWLQAVYTLCRGLRQERIDAYARRSSPRLPTHPRVREKLVTSLVDRDLTGSAWYRFLQDLAAFLELAHDLNVVIEASGD